MSKPENKRDEVLRRMPKTQPTPHKPIGKVKRKEAPASPPSDQTPNVTEDPQGTNETKKPRR